MGTEADATKRVGRKVRAGTKRPPKTFPGRLILLKDSYVVEHKILKIEHRFYHFLAPKLKMWDNVHSVSDLGHFCLENRNPCYYTGLPKGTKKRWHRHLKNRTLYFRASGTMEDSVARPFVSFASGEGLFPWTLCMSYLVTMICRPSCESLWRNPQVPSVV